MVLRIFLMLKLMRRNSEANEPGGTQLAEENSVTVNPMSSAHNPTSLTYRDNRIMR